MINEIPSVRFSRIIFTACGTQHSAVQVAATPPTTSKHAAMITLQSRSFGSQQTAGAGVPKARADTNAKSIATEVLHAYEIGYRYHWNEKFSLDVTAYYNGYNHLEGAGALGAPIVNLSPFFIDIPDQIINQRGGQTHGLELCTKYTPVPQWTVSSGITELRGNSPAATLFPAAANNPPHQVTISSKLDLTRFVNFDASYFYNDAISKQLPPLNRLDIGLSTKPFRGFAFSVWGRNLQHERHEEAIPQQFLGGEIRRSVVFKVIWEPDEGSTRAVQ